jgi:hypothetical protein
VKGFPDSESLDDCVDDAVRWTVNWCLRRKHRVNPLPRMDVIVLGDFNDAIGADDRPRIETHATWKSGKDCHGHRGRAEWKLWKRAGKPEV